MFNCKSIKKFKEELPQCKPLICIDYGAKNIGTGISDHKRIFAMPYKNFKNDKFFVQKILEMIESKKVCGVIVGYPLTIDGEISDSCRAVENFMRKNFSDILAGVPYYFHDERFSTQIASEILKEFSLRRKTRDKIDNKHAATVILQSALDTMALT